MQTLSIREARRKLTDVVRAAERGQSVIITRRGKKVAMVTPCRRPRLRGLPDLTAFRASLKISGPSLTEELLRQRDEERA